MVTRVDGQVSIMSSADSSLTAFNSLTSAIVVSSSPKKELILASALLDLQKISIIKIWRKEHPIDFKYILTRIVSWRRRCGYLWMFSLLHPFLSALTYETEDRESCVPQRRGRIDHFFCFSAFQFLPALAITRNCTCWFVQKLSVGFPCPASDR